MRLVEITAALLHDPAVRDSELLNGVCESTVSMYPGSEPVRPWMGYLADEAGTWVGTCAFKSPPEDGRVEIAYFTFPKHQGRGVATRMAQALIELAVAHDVESITAQTLPEENASTRILRKLGFEHRGSVDHPEDGEVWQWDRPAAG